MTWNQPSATGSGLWKCFGHLYSYSGEKIGKAFELSQPLPNFCHNPSSLSMPEGFVARYSNVVSSGFIVPVSYLRFFNSQFNPTGGLVTLNGATHATFTTGEDRILATWTSRENHRKGQFFSFEGKNLTKVFTVALHGSAAGQGEGPCIYRNKIFGTFWVNRSDDQAYGIWISKTGEHLAPSFAIGPVTSYLNAIVVGDGIAITREHNKSILLNVYRPPETYTPTSHTSFTSLPTQQTLSTHSLECSCPAITAGQIRTFAPEQPGISGPGIAGWVVAGVLLVITLGLSSLLLRRKETPAEEEAQPRYSSLPTRPQNDGSHYVGMDVINQDHDQAVEKAINLLRALNYKVTAQT